METISNFSKVFSLSIKMADMRNSVQCKKKKHTHRLWVQRDLGLMPGASI